MAEEMNNEEQKRNSINVQKRKVAQGNSRYSLTES